LLIPVIITHSNALQLAGATHGVGSARAEERYPQNKVLGGPPYIVRAIFLAVVCPVDKILCPVNLRLKIQQSESVILWPTLHPSQTDEPWRRGSWLASWS
jgi:hypothetical protein